MITLSFAISLFLILAAILVIFLWLGIGLEKRPSKEQKSKSGNDFLAPQDHNKQQKQQSLQQYTGLKAKYSYSGIPPYLKVEFERR